MLNSKAAAGVCSACKYDPDCIYEASSRSAILQCEQFELAFPAQAARRSTSPEPRGRSSSAQDTNGYAGLCSNCENRSTCIYPKPEGGVWRCDEYV